MAERMQTLVRELQQKREDLKLPALLKRQFQKVSSKDEGPSTNKDQPTLRIMQWNMLAQALSEGDDNFVLCPAMALQWEHRQLHLLEEMVGPGPALICLQEVDHFPAITQLMATVGYQGCFFPKPDSPCLYSHVNYGPDGCAVLWRTDLIKLELQNNFVLKDDAGMETNQVAILCQFSHLATGKKFYVANTHLKSKAPYWQLRHEQGKYLESVLRENVPESSPLIVCGDFNGEPSEQVYGTFQNSPCGLDSAYRYLTDSLQEPGYTTWKIRGGPKGNKETAQCIDYVWFSTKHLQPLALLKLPTEQEIGIHRLPSLTYPSDHLSLVVDFAFTG
ncbi:hypothetical protein ACOMHN_014373 [Nucella lapillus]